MINSQNFKAIIVKLIEQENKLKMVYEEAKKTKQPRLYEDACMGKSLYCKR